MKKLKMGMVGGGSGAFIGAVHRRAAIMDGEVEFVAGALSSTADKALASGRELGLTDERNYASWERMLEAELSLPEEERVDFVSRSEEHTSELQSRQYLVCRLLLEKK